MTQSTYPHFADRLISRIRHLGHPPCLGLDPHLAQIPALFQRGDMRSNSPQTPQACVDFLLAILERAEGRAAIVKPQIAFFEQMGWRGLEVLTKVVERARALGFITLLDAKRGDIGSTAEGYAKAYLEPGSPIEVDSITLNPYLRSTVRGARKQNADCGIAYARAGGRTTPVAALAAC
mgnify:CR=1 FL=1